MLRRLLSLNWLYGVLGILYPPLRYVPLGALAAVALVLGGLWFATRYMFTHLPASLGIKTLPAVLIRKPAVPSSALPLDFELTERGGGTLPFGSTLGSGRSVVYVYSPYCGHCAKMLPAFLEFARRLALTDTPLVGIQYQGTRDTLGSAGNTPGRLLADPQGAFCGKIGVGEFTVFVVDAQGRVVLRSGGQNLSAIEASAREG
ncbi:MAG: redoxin domain-containing protein [Elusimicrobia bacterium]|nr:redoxin domain-containing protein [Elusimicrobiota bacterium]